MKKKYIAIISIAATGLVFGSLIYCGISAFPELLEVEGQEVKEDDHVLYVDDTVIVKPEKQEEAVVIIDVPTSNGLTKGFVPSNHGDDEVHYIGFAKDSASIVIEESRSTSSFVSSKDSIEPVHFVSDFDSAVSFGISTDVVIEDNNTYSESHYYGDSHRESSEIVSVKKSSRASSKTTKTDKSSHKEIIECSLLVVAAVDIISMLLVNRKRHHRFH